MIETSPSTRSGHQWLLLAAIVLLTFAFAIRHGTRVLSLGHEFDEVWITIPIADLIDRGWTVETAIDFQETKGPALIWPYAAIGHFVGGELNRLRLISIGFYVLGGVVLLLLASRCGVRGPPMLWVTLFYVLLPHNSVLGQLVMSEPSFNCGAILLMLVFLWGRTHRILGPILFGVLLSILLHNRIHAVAFAGAACLVAFERDRLQSWPWWLACILAGLSRIPLWLRWGGLVSPDYQSMHGLGLDPANLTYLGAAFSLFLAVFIPTVLMDVQLRRRAWMIGLGGISGLLMGILAAPDLTETVHFLGRDLLRYQGFISTGARMAASEQGMVQSAVLAATSTVGMASLGALAAIAWSPGESQDECTNQTSRLAFWTLLTGWAMYLLTHGYVFDRYLLPWAILLPVIWTTRLPIPWRILQVIVLTSVFGWLASRYLF